MTAINEPRIQAVIFDWAGTTVDFGSRAPVEVFVEIFRRSGISITAAEARGPMGRAKRDHLAALTALPQVIEQWQQRYGRLPAQADIDRMYVDFLPLQKEVLARGSDVIAGVAETVAWLRQRGIRIGSTTGYTRALMDVLVPMARQGGFDPEAVIGADDVTAGRPAPWMIFRAAEQLGVYPMSSVLIVDDTPVGIEAGRNAQTWAVAVAKTGNAMGLSEEELSRLPAQVLDQRLQEIRADFAVAGAHDIIDSVADLPVALDRIEQRLKRGELPDTSLARSMPRIISR